ncbi:MAG: hypothetical protein PWQ12_484 [Clostridiales bacterium]|jgi:8-oxo-dGTP pyrophosphatase MutT (NUDIX family)|nr:hypothetical protein [Clostridiales bacterium]
MLSHIINQLKTYRPNTRGVKRESAVLIPLICHNDEWHLLFERRALTLNAQPGEICFPGGGIEPDESTLDAAIRETCEELNIEVKDIEVLGQIDSILTRFDTIIHCHVGIIHLPLESIRYSEDEVDLLFTVPMTYFLSHDPDVYWMHSRFDIDEDFPFDSIPNGRNYNFKNASYPTVFYQYEDFTIWGLTARMVQHFVEILKEDPSV